MPPMAEPKDISRCHVPRKGFVDSVLDIFPDYAVGPGRA